MFALLLRALGFLVGLLLGAATTSFGASDPEWIKNPPKENSTNKYYVGRGEGASEAKAFSEAYRNGYESAIRDNFGFRAAIQTEAQTTATDESIDKRVRETVEEVEVHGFEVEEQYVHEGPNDRASAWILFRYSKISIAAEKARISALSTLPRREEARVSTIGTSALANRNGQVQIDTEPTGARVVVDGEPFGRTPLLLLGQLEPGRHELTVEHPEFEVVKENFLLSPGAKLEIHHSLKRAKGRLDIESTPPGATVLLEGRTVGITPLRGLPVLAAKEIEVKVIHPLSYAQTQRIRVARGEVRTLAFSLALRPAKVSVLGGPAGASVEVDGTDVGVIPIIGKEVDPGDHTVRVSKPGFVDYQVGLSFAAGETYSLGPFALRPESEAGSESRHIYNRERSTLSWELGVSFDSTMREASNQKGTKTTITHLSAGGFAERRIRDFGVRYTFQPGILNYGGGSGAPVAKNVWSQTLGVPFYFSSSREEPQGFIAPGVGVTKMESPDGKESRMSPFVQATLGLRAVRLGGLGFDLEFGGRFPIGTTYLYEGAAVFGSVGVGFGF